MDPVAERALLEPTAAGVLDSLFREDIVWDDERGEGKLTRQGAVASRVEAMRSLAQQLRARRDELEQRDKSADGDVYSALMKVSKEAVAAKQSTSD